MQSSAAMPGDSPVKCPKCDKPCVLQTAITKNKHEKQFYTCVTEDCKVFVRWLDNIPATKGASGYNCQKKGWSWWYPWQWCHARGDSQNTTCTKCGHSSSDCYPKIRDSPMRCPNCDTLCIVRTALTLANYGRKFYICKYGLIFSSPRYCSHTICWVDSIPTTSGRGGGGSYNNQ